MLRWVVSDDTVLRLCDRARASISSKRKSIIYVYSMAFLVGFSLPLSIFGGANLEESWWSALPIISKILVGSWSHRLPKLYTDSVFWHQRDVSCIYPSSCWWLVWFGIVWRAPPGNSPSANGSGMTQGPLRSGVWLVNRGKLFRLPHASGRYRCFLWTSDWRDRKAMLHIAYKEKIRSCRNMPTYYFDLSPSAEEEQKETPTGAVVI